MRNGGNGERLGGRKPVKPVLHLHVVTVVAFDVQKFARRLCFQTDSDCIKFAGQYV